MASFMRLETRTESGTINRGKYTLPKMDELAINIFEVLIKQSEK